MVRRRVLALTLLTVAALSACEGESPEVGREPTVVPTVDRAAGWREIRLDGQVRTIEAVYDHLLVAGRWDDGKPLLAGVADDIPDLTLRQPPVWAGAGIRGVSTDGQVILASEGNDPSEQRPSRLFLADDYGSYPLPTVRDRQRRRPVWLDPLLDEEMDVRVLGAVPVDRAWRLHAWELTDKWEFIDNGPQLYVDGPPSPDNLVSGTTEVSVVVAGRIANRPDVPAGSVQAWLIPSDYSFSGTRWQRLPLRPAPDSLSDIAFWDVGFWIVGQRGLRPVVYDFDSGDEAGRMIVGPPTVLDASRPKVFLANLPVSQDGRLVLATQSEIGPTVWVQRGDSWTELAAPPGNLEAAEIVQQSIYLLIDGRLWWRELPDDLIEEPWETESASPSSSPSPSP